MTSTVLVLRHVERDKASEDQQAPTEGGEITAYAMGAIFRRDGKLTEFERVVSSPQPRARRTAEVFLRGLTPLDTDGVQFEIETDDRINDFSSDKRELVKLGLDEAKAFAKKNGVGVEQAIFLTGAGKDALNLKTNEFLELIYELGQKEGNSLVTCHGGSIDAACIRLKQRLDSTVKFGMGANDGMFDKVEGFVGTFEDGVLKQVAIVRVPEYIKTLQTVVT